MTGQHPIGQQNQSRSTHEPRQPGQSPERSQQPTESWPAGQSVPTQLPAQQPIAHQQPPTQQPQQQSMQPPAQHQRPQSVQPSAQQRVPIRRPQQIGQQQGQQLPIQSANRLPLAQPMGQQSGAKQQASGQQAAAAQSEQMGELPEPQQAQLGQEAGQRQLATEQSTPTGNPFVDVYDGPEELTVFADLPGCRDEDIDVRTSNNTLYITAERSEEVGGEDRPLLQERSRRVERSIELPALVDAEKAEASCENGVCRIVLPKSEDERQQTIGFQ